MALSKRNPQNILSKLNEGLSSDDDDSDVDFSSSVLGTKNYWDEAYKNELDNFNHHGDIGDIWFGEESVMRVIDWINSSGLPHNSSILDIGCGNGITLSYLADEGFNNLYAVDYSEAAVNLAKAVALKRGTSIYIEVGNILEMNNPGRSELLHRKYDVCHDKGTFDAVSLMPDDAKGAIQKYIYGVSELIKPNGLFIITSCNWTEKELLQKFGQYFEKKKTIPTPVFSFGGKIGSSVTALVLRRLPN